MVKDLFLRFENMLCNYHFFIPFVKNVWSSIFIENLEGFKFMRKLKVLKEQIESVE